MTIIKLSMIVPALTLIVGVGHAAPVSTCGAGVSRPAVGSNPGGARVVTGSTTTFAACIDAPATARVDQFATTLTAVAQAGAILTADRASFKSPALTSDSIPQSSGTWALMLGGLGVGIRLKLLRRENLRLIRALVPGLILAVGMLKAAPLAPNPGGATVVTNSTTTSITYVDTPVSQRVDQYSTTVTAILNGNQTVFQQNFPLPFNDAVVQAALMQADMILAADKANAKAPVLTFSSTTLQGSQLAFVQTSPTPDYASCTIIKNVDSFTCDDVTFTVSSTSAFGPSVVFVGDNRSDEFHILAGQLDVNINVDRAFRIDRNAVTTNTFLTSQSYEVDGITMLASVPEPGTWALMLGGLGVGIGLKWLRRKNLRPLRALVPGLILAVGMLKSAPIAPNPGGAIVVTNSTTTSITYVDTPVSQRVDQYSTTVTAILNGSQTVFQQNFSLPFNDAVVQAALMQADMILAADKANAKAPVLTFNSTTLQGSQFAFVQTSPTPDYANCMLINNAIGFICDGVTFTSATTTTFGPNVILVGDNQSEEFHILPGQSDINVNTDRAFLIDRNAVTTNTFLTTQSYEIDGNTTLANVPEPGTWGLMIAGLGVVVGRKWRALR